MSIFDDISQFLEKQLDEFLRNNPHLELQAIEEQLKEQERDTLKLLLDLKKQQQSLQDEILAIANKIQTWHLRVSKAKEAGREDLAQAAQEREAALMREGNQVWGKMTGIKTSMAKSQELLQQIQQRRQEIQTQYKQAQQTKTQNQTFQNQSKSNSYTTGWNQGATSQNRSAADSLEAEFQKWELDEELEQMKRNLKQ
jgi:uncharacterized protein (TIGR04376 family)